MIRCTHHLFECRVMNDDLSKAASMLRRARNVVVFTGAGVSAESGIATFRDALTGLWSRYDPSRMATENAFREDPSLVWGWYEWRRAQAAAAAPNAGHIAVSQLAHYAESLTVVTQNVDDLHERAGSEPVFHLHGSLDRPRCIDCMREIDAPPLEQKMPEEGARIDPPICGDCGGLARPGFVWFGEELPSDVWKDAVSAVGECDALISIGTSGAAYPAASLPIEAARRGAAVIHVNREAVPVSGQREIALVGPGGVLLPQLMASAFG